MQTIEQEISTDKCRLDVALIHDFLAKRSYWAHGIPLHVVQMSIDNALCFGMYQEGRQIGFARVITDLATFAYLADVFIIEDHRGKGLGKALIKAILEHPDLKGLRMWLLGTRDAHELYRQFGFRKLAESDLLDRFMVIRNPGIYHGNGGPP